MAAARRSPSSSARGARRLGEHAERELGVAEREAVAVDEARAALLLAVDEDLGLAVDLLEVEVAAVEEDLGVVVGDARRRRARRRCRALARWWSPACGRCTRAALLARGSI